MNFLKRITSRYIKQLYVRLNEAIRVYGRFTGRFGRHFYKEIKSNKFPTTIQLPITYKCNFDCVMCGMRQLVSKRGFTVQEMKTVLSNKLFNKVNSVGVNGGEPFLLDNIDEYISALFETLPNLKNVFLISNGFFTDKILDKSKKILEICHKHDACYHLSISIDGYEDMQDTMRGKSGAFTHAVSTCNAIISDRENICDSFNTICTITRVNVDRLAELDSWAKDCDLPISYNIATVHKRIQNEHKFNEFSVFTDEHARLLTEEFFYSKYLENKSETYFALYYFVHTGERIASCTHKTDVVTLTPNGGLSYCATFSDEIGNALNNEADKIYFAKENLEYRKKLHSEHCKHCSHYSSSLTYRNYLSKYGRERMRFTKIFR